MFLDQVAAHTVDEVAGEERTVLRLHHRIAPYQVAVLPLSKKDTLLPLSQEVLKLLHSLERDQIGAYLHAIPRLKPGPVRAAAASILASDAQHIAILRLAQGLEPAPSPFVTAAE